MYEFQMLSMNLLDYLFLILKTNIEILYLTVPVSISIFKAL